uniref:PCI domain-containing protein n=1 Tax=Aplanochytrium stocchinoi TaxID=215587 RepID=A0A6S8APH1_9STRA|mmetsp:Transcript_6281/g.7911  ORF Transcript_6281/g.7911 Transcript_6281/m.7911 type:complete len:487 (+) Transcript_6281:29-1489(+)|eukprot:CAMPEP_0204843750 /NCGR_PEP_ID=MMETSP1346-20131115/48165_1 /ASSEMBLY_ACC=CAM_ASM_000771 /TAXON_ID=215587 /ORGANISM="Aplanochytrium stocchinoi, Strain GSBS06" /LENGTH=486 /DNA_ID=CAMNT_0051982951 /DNA_START=220 /DNA_END=1680 /DNA_ORIENTATION=+
MAKKEPKKVKEPKMEEEDDKEEAIPDYFKAMEDNIMVLEKAVELNDKNLIRRLWRKNTNLRKNMSLLDFQDVLMVYVPADCPSRKVMLNSLDAAQKEEMDTGGDRKDRSGEAKKTEISLEVECYLHLFIVSRLMGMKPMRTKEALESSRLIVERASSENRRSLDSFVSKGWHWYARCNELLGKAKDIRPELIAAHRTACLRLNEMGQSVLTNLILRSYTEDNLITQAMTFASKTTFPESASNNQQVRNLYYMGKAHAIQADYSKANDCLIRAIRKAPTNTGLGFRVHVYKLAVVAQLLMGETPDRSWFSNSELKVHLEPYFHLVKAVRNGSVADYDKILKTDSAKFSKDNTMTLIVRLRSSVIKTGLRHINIAYSCISFKDIAFKLELSSATDAELICAKAIRDRIIEATIDHEKSVLQSNDTQDIYSTIEPKAQFHKRIEFCLEVHNAAVKAHKYPPNSHRAKLEKDENKENGDVATIDDDLDDM